MKMEESLKTGRIIYLTFLGVCAVILLFGLSPNRADLYESAVRELEALSSLDEAALHDYVHFSVNSEFKILDFKKVADLASNKWINKTISHGVDWTPVSILPFVFENIPMTGTLVEIERYFLTNHPVFVFQPYPDYLENGFRKCIDAIGRAAGKTDAPSFRIESVDMKDSQSMADFKAMLETSRGTVINQGRDSFVKLSVIWSSHYGVKKEEQLIRGRYVALKPHTLSRWLESQEDLKSLTQILGDQKTLFLNLRPVWNEIRTSTINGAIVALNRKKLESKKSMSVLGLTAHEEIVVIVAPLVTFCVVIYLLTHIFHIRSIAGKNLELLSEFSWIVLFAGFLSRSLTYGSILLLPIIANTVILIRAWNIHSNFTWIGVLLVVGTLIAIWKTLREINYLQRLAQGNQLTNKLQ
jgi:hypothetical protein